MRSSDEIQEIVANFALTAHLAGQSLKTPVRKSKKSDLQQLVLGASAAENEFRTLEDYFVETAEFLRTLRGEVNVVAGRKGSGKTAIFFQVRDRFRDKKGTLIADLKPESHQLSLLRSELLKVAGEGALDHTFAAFWYYLILSELLLALKKGDEHRSRRDPHAVLAAIELTDLLESHNILESGDFTTRINRCGCVCDRASICPSPPAFAGAGPTLSPYGAKAHLREEGAILSPLQLPSPTLAPISVPH